MENIKNLVLDDMFVPAKIASGENEKIKRPVSNFWKDSWRSLLKHKTATISLFILLIIVFFALLGPYMNEYKYYDTNYEETYQSPNSSHWFGTDKFGRDQWTRVWQGTRISIYIALLAATLDLLIGVTFGAISGYFGGKIDSIMQRIIEVLVGIPRLIVVILLMMFMKPGILTLTIAMVFTGWVSMARIVRGQILKLKGQEYVLAAKTLGASNFDIIFKQLLPNMLGVIIVNMMFTIPSAIFTEAFLSFIGLGLQEPLASLGVLINDGYQSMRNQFYLLLYPAIVIILLMVGFNILSDGLRDAFDPRMRK
ncbi:ABC transporter permease [Brassicibacter mesophilus]|uniref:ABC transporter permease n=1 Tax=Brassicibacter mesophilus TaxID=745119 RepID=UPI003D222A52